MNEMQQVMEDLEAEGEEELEEMLEPQLQPPPHGLARQVDTAVPLSELEALNQALLQVPEGFHIHSKVERGVRRRKNIFEDPDKPAIDWATAEELAFASILADGIPIRMTGEDVERGTFSQRHAVFHDVENGEAYVPLQEIPQAKASFEIQNSPLSENAALGFEFGYNITFPRRFVLWEAQYGDFVNTAQAMIDEFILSARAKWEQTPSLVMLLPHGQEGQGPDHSTGRPERFLQMAADINLRLANCTTSAQYFHLLRRQAALLESDPLPLIVLTPKSLLRHPLVASPPRAFAEGRWQPVIDDAQAAQHPQQVQRVILCNGKVFIDLVTADQRQNTPEIAIVRVEQLYPFPAADLHQVLEEYPNKQEVVWVQEEPENMGAWTYISPLLEELLEGAWPLRYIGRQPYSSPAEGSSAMHSIVQSNLIERAYDLESIRVKES
jgi:2-oxoglutarate dehydrogenase E1 component